MPVFGQATSFNDRLVSLLSSVVCNTNGLYNGHRPIAMPPSAVSSNTAVRRRPLFREAILRKATNLCELSPASWVTPTATPATTTILEVVLIVDNGNQGTEAACDNIADFISSLVIPCNSESRIEITRVYSHSIREDLNGNSAAGQITGAGRQRVFVALGSAIMGLHHYLLMMKHGIEGTGSRSNNNSSEHLPELYLVLGVICIDPPPHLWKAYGNPLLDHFDSKQIPSLVVGYDDADDAIHSLGHILKETTYRPQTLIVVGRQAARLWTTGEHLDSNKKNQDRNQNVKLDDACFWIARLITKYAEALQRIQTTPGAVISSSRIFGKETNSMEDALSMRSKL